MGILFVKKPGAVAPANPGRGILSRDNNKGRKVDKHVTFNDVVLYVDANDDEKKTEESLAVRIACRWELVMLPFLIYEVAMFPVRVSIAKQLFPSDYVVDLVFLVDLFFMLLHITHPHHHLAPLYYLNNVRFTWVWSKAVLFLLTFLAFLLPYVGALSGSYSNTSFFLFMSLRAVRFPRLFLFMRQRMANPRSNLRLYALFKFVLVLFFAAHWIGCFWFFIARYYEFSSSTWFFTHLEACKRTAKHYMQSTDVCIHAHSSSGRKYLLALFWGVNALTNFGYLGYNIGNSLEAVFGVLVIFAQILIYSYILGTIVHFLVSKDEAVEQYKLRMKTLKSYIAARHLPFDLASRIQRYFWFQHSKQGDDLSFFHLLPLALRLRVSHIEHSRKIEQVPVFRGCCPQFLNELMTRLRPVHLMPGEVFMNKNDTSREVALLQMGVMDVWNGKVHIQSIRHDADRAQLLGDLAMFVNIRQPYSVQATDTSHATLSVLARSDLEELLEHYPEQHDIIITHVLSQLMLDRSGTILSHVSDDDEEFLALQTTVREALLAKKELDLGALTYAATEGDIETVRQLLQKGVDVDASDYDARTTLHLACAEGKLKIVQTLVEFGAKIDIRDRWGTTPLRDAISGGFDAIATLLVKLGAVLDFPNPCAALKKTALESSFDQMKRLLSFGLDPSSVDYDKRSVIHTAALTGNLGLVHFLVNQSVNVNLRDRWGNTPLQDAVLGGHNMIADFLRSFGGELNLEYAAGLLCSAAGEGDVNRLSILLRNGANIEDNDYDERTALHLAASDGQLWSVHCLLAHRANVNCRDRWGGTPLDDAIRGQFWDVAKLLQANGGVTGMLRSDEEAEAASLALDNVSILDIRGQLCEYFRQSNLLKAQQQVFLKDINEFCFRAIKMCRTLKREFPRVVGHLPKRIILPLAIQDPGAPSDNRSIRGRLPTVGSSTSSTGAVRDVIQKGSDFLNKVVLNFPKVAEALNILEKIFQIVTNEEGSSALTVTGFYDTPQYPHTPTSREKRTTPMTLLQLHTYFLMLGIDVSSEDLHAIYGAEDASKPALKEEDESESDAFSYPSDDEALATQTGKIMSHTDLLVRASFRNVVVSMITRPMSRSVQSKVLQKKHEMCLSPAEQEIVYYGISFMEETFQALDVRQEGFISCDEHHNILQALGGTYEDLATLDINQFVFHFLVWVVEQDEEEEESTPPGGPLSVKADFPVVSSPISKIRSSRVFDNITPSPKKNSPTLASPPAEPQPKKAEKQLRVAGRVVHTFAARRRIAARLSLFLRLGLDAISSVLLKKAFEAAGMESPATTIVNVSMFRQILEEISDEIVLQPAASDLFDSLTAMSDKPASQFTLEDLELAIRSFNSTNQKALLEMKSKLASQELDYVVPKSAGPFILSPSSRRLAFWNKLMLATAVYYFFMVPFRIVFLSNVPLEHGFWEIEYVVDSLVFLDIIVHFNTAYLNSKSVLVCKRRKIARNYLSGLFQRHLVILFPLDVLARLSGAGVHLIAWLRLPRMLRFLKLRDHFKEEQSNLERDTVFAGVKRLLIYVVFLTHILACLWHTLGEAHTFSWLSTFSGYGTGNASTFDRYLLSFYSVWATMSTVGLGSIQPRTELEYAFVTIVLYLNLTALAWVVAEVSNLVLKSDESLAALRKQLQSVETFLRNRTLPVDLQGEIRSFFSFKFTDSDQKQLQNEIFTSLSHSLQVDVTKTTSLTLLNVCPLLEGCEQTFINEFAVLLKEAIYPPDSVLFRAGEPGRQLTIIASGEVKLTQQVPGQEESVTLAFPGDAIGEFSWVFGLKHTSTAVVPSSCFVSAFCLSLSDFKTLASQFPVAMDVLANNALTTYEKSICTARLSSRSTRSTRSSGSNKLPSSRSAHSARSSILSTPRMQKTSVGELIHEAKQAKRNARTVELLSAAQKGNEDKVKQLLVLDERVINRGDYDRRTALMLAASEGHLDLVKVLIDAGADINMRDRFDNTALMDAIRHKHYVVAALLFRHGCELTFPDPAFVLNNVVADNNLELIAEYLNNGMSVNCRDDLLRTPLHVAASCGRLEAVELLLERGADPNPIDLRGGTPLKEAITANHLQIVARLQEYRSVTLGNLDAACVLCIAASTSDLPKIRTLYECHVDINSADYDFRTPLHLAASCGNLSVVDYLLTLPELEVNPLDRWLNTPMDDAIRHGHSVIALLLAKNGGQEALSEQMREKYALFSAELSTGLALKRQRLADSIQEFRDGVALRKLEAMSAMFGQFTLQVEGVLRELSSALVVCKQDWHQSANKFEFVSLRSRMESLAVSYPALVAKVKAYGSELVVNIKPFATDSNAVIGDLVERFVSYCTKLEPVISAVAARVIAVDVGKQPMGAAAESKTVSRRSKTGSKRFSITHSPN